MTFEAKKILITELIVAYTGNALNTIVGKPSPYYLVKMKFFTGVENYILY